MKQLRICWSYLHTALSKIHLVDRCLILFMLALLLQSAFSLFFHTEAGTGAGDIDIIVRTSSAAIFGYFLSGNFIRPAAPKPSSTNPSPAEPPAAAPAAGGYPPFAPPQNRIGFSAPGQAEEPERGGTAAEPSSPPDPEAACNRLQIIVATCIGLFCLVTLLLMRNVAQWNAVLADSPSMTATVAQFRDFVSGCVGFLIGCPTHRTDLTRP